MLNNLFFCFFLFFALHFFPILIVNIYIVCTHSFASHSKCAFTLNWTTLKILIGIETNWNCSNWPGCADSSLWFLFSRLVDWLPWKSSFGFTTNWFVWIQFDWNEFAVKMAGNINWTFNQWLNLNHFNCIIKFWHFQILTDCSLHSTF